MKFLKIDKNGTKYYEKRVTCWRCGNIAGGLYIVGTNNGQMVPSGLDNGVCWKCHGTGYTTEIVKEYTPEHLAKLEKARARRAAKKAAELEARQAEIDAAAERAAAEMRAREESEAAERARINESNARSSFVGSIGDKVEFVATVKKSISYKRRSFYGYGDEVAHVHEFVDANGNVFVWFTSAGILPNVGDTVKVKATIKNHSWNDKGEPDGIQKYKQTIITRVKVQEIEPVKEPEEAEQEPANDPTPEEIPEGAQIVVMPYIRYKKHYSDCKTVKDSYNEERHEITVIIPDGRMKNSGVRGKRITRYRFKWTDKNTGEIFFTPYSAVDEEHAIKHLQKDFPEAINIEVVNVYFSRT